MSGVIRRPPPCILTGPRGDAPQLRRRPDEGPCFEGAEGAQVRLAGGQLVRVQHLPGHHAVSAAGVREDQNGLAPLPGLHVPGPGDEAEGLRLQGVPGQDGHRLTVDLVAGGTAPAEVVVIHAGQVVVDEGVGVDALHGGGEGQRLLQTPPAELTEGQRQHRPHPLAPGQEAVAHSLLEPPIGLPGGREEALQIPLRRAPAAVIAGLKAAHGHASPPKGCSMGSPPGPFCSFTTSCSALWRAP